MGISFVGISGAVTVASGDVTVSEPAGCQAGDYLEVPIGYRDSIGFSLPSGWALAAPLQNTGNSTSNGSTDIASGVVAYKIRGASAESGVIFGRSGGDLGIGCMVAYRGVDPVNPIDVAASFTLTANSTTVAIAAGLTTTSANACLVMHGFSCNASNPFASNERALTDPVAAAWTERRDSGTATGADGGLMVADAIKATPGATGQLQFTAALSRMHAIAVVALRPLAATTMAVDAGSGVSTGQAVVLRVTEAVGAGAGQSAGQQVKLNLTAKLLQGAGLSTGQAVALRRALAVVAGAGVSTGKAILDRLTLLVGKGQSISTGQAVVINTGSNQPSPPASAKRTITGYPRVRSIVGVQRIRTIIGDPRIRLIVGEGGMPWCGRDFTGADVTEDEPFAFDFVNQGIDAGVTITSAVASLTVLDGVDAAPSSRLHGTCGINGTVVSQMLKTLVPGVLYKLKIVVTLSNGQIKSLFARVRVDYPA